MRVHRDIDNLPTFRNAVVTIGTFDGVHQGHRQIIEKLKAQAKTVDGETVIIKPARWSMSDAARLMDTAAKLARLAAGMETDRATLQGPGGEPLFAPSDVAQALKAIAESQARHADR